jgi:hypothetical protein
MKDRELIDKARKVAAKAETEKHFGAALLHYAHMLETTTEEKIRKEARVRLRVNVRPPPLMLTSRSGEATDASALDR